MEYTTLNKKEFKLDISTEVRLMAKSVIKNINQLQPVKHLPILVPVFLQN